LNNDRNTLSNTHIRTHYPLLVKIYMGSIKFIGDPHNLIGLMNLD